MGQENVGCYLQCRSEGGGGSSSQMVTMLQQRLVSPNCVRLVSSGSMSYIFISVVNSDPDVWSSGTL